VQTVLIFGDERYDHLFFSDSLYRQKVANPVGRMSILVRDMSEPRFIHSLTRLV